MAECPACDHTNPYDARFCQNCGKKLVNICRRCGTENLLDTKFCKSCGVKLAEAKFSISDNFAQKSWNEFSSYSVFSEMTSAKGWVRQQLYPYAKQLVEYSDLEDKSIIEEKMALFLPIINRDWCISSLNMNKTVIKYGALWAGTSGFAVFDFDKKILYFLPYEWLDNCRQDGDAISLINNKGSTISMTIRVSRPSELGNVLSPVTDLIGSIIDNMVLKKSAVEQELKLMRIEDETRNHWELVKIANNFVSDIYDFFQNVITMKREIDKA